MTQNNKLSGVLLAAIFLAANFLTACAPLQAAESTSTPTREATTTPTPTQTNTPTLTQTPTQPTATSTLTKTPEFTPTPEATAPPEKTYPLGCYDTEINTQAVNDYLAAHPEFPTLEDAMKAHIDTYGKANVWVGGAVFQESDAQQNSILYSPLVLKYSVIKYPSELDTINVGCVTLAYPRYEKDNKVSTGTMTILTDVEVNGKWSGSPYIFGLITEGPIKAKIFTSRAGYASWLTTDEMK